jgi:hypothetical protein
MINLNEPPKVNCSKEEEELYWEAFYSEYGEVLLKDNPRLDKICPSALLDEIETWDL